MVVVRVVVDVDVAYAQIKEVCAHKAIQLNPLESPVT